MIKKTLLAGLLALFCWTAMAAYGQAQGGDIRLESRVRRLETQIMQVRSQISQISFPGVTTQRNSPGATGGDPGLLTDPSLEEQFDNLATLAIELKQQVRQLETRVSQLEQATDPQP